MSDTNQIIHERLMGGECYHDSLNDAIDGDDYFVQCSKCLAMRSPYEDWNLPIYTQDLNLAFAAQAKAIERFGEAKYAVALCSEVLQKADFRWDRNFTNELFSEHDTVAIATANAEQRCAAIVKLLENEK